MSHPKPPSSKRRPSDPEEREAFKRIVSTLDAGECVAHDSPDDCEGDLEAHHVVSQQQLRKAGLHDRLWDPSNGMTVCNLAHRRHTLAVERIARGRLPARCVRFAAMYGLTDVLDRYYDAAT